jgi:transcriptional antiterminator RfaH
MTPTLENSPDIPAHEWFCLRTQRKREHIAAAILSKIEDIEVFCPRISQIKKTRTGKKRFVEAMFPGYIFARFSLSTNYRRVIHTQGVSGLVGRGDHKAMPREIIEDLKASLPEGVIEAPDLSLEPGAKVQFVSGSLQGLNGEVLAQLSSSNRVQILLEFLGREITVAASTDDILLNPEGE